MVALIVVANALMICAVVLQVMYTKSPAHTVAEYIENQKFTAAQVYCKQNKTDGIFYQTILNRRMTTFFDELDIRYENGSINLSSYAERCRQTLDTALDAGADPALEDRVKKHFQALLEQTYTDFLQSIVAGKTVGDAIERRQLTTIFDTVMSQELAADPDRAQVLLEQLNDLSDDALHFPNALSLEQNANYTAAIQNYLYIAPESPLAPAVREAIDRCITAWATDVRQRLNAPATDASTLHDQIGWMEHWLEILPEKNMLTDARKAELTALRNETLPHCATLMKQHALAAAGAAQPDHNDVFQTLLLALEYNPDDKELAATLKKIALAAHDADAQDNQTIATMLLQALQYDSDHAELQAAVALRKARLKADLRKWLPDCLNSYDAMAFTTETISSVMAIMPEDADIRALDRAISDQFSHAFHGTTQGFVSLFYEQYGNWKVTEHLLLNPVADAFGVLHQSASLYRMTATAAAPGLFYTAHSANDASRFGTLTCSVFASPSCTGTGVLEVRTAQELDASGQPVWSEPVWTAPVDRTVNGLQVELNLSHAIAVEIRLTAKKGSVSVLLDGASLKPAV
ncbi:MAG: hypothetical protein IJY28_01570 [Clostridia bacterium]|nr:hypothetical protein [Clostridia bacterium]